MPIDFSIAWKTGAKIINEIISRVPNLILGLLIFILFLVVASVARSLTRRFTLHRLTHQGIALLLARLVHLALTVLGFLIAISVIAP
jgi:small conductance mechanosensitive channel